MLGHKLFQRFQYKFETYTTVRKVCDYSQYGTLEPRVYRGIEAIDFEHVYWTIDSIKPDVVINCIGVIRKLATDPINCLEINSLFPRKLAHCCTEKKIRLIHISTDFVFSGNKGQYKEEDIADSDELYGRTKFLGEIDAPGCLTLRVSVIGHEVKTCNSLVEWLLSNKAGKVFGYRKAINNPLTNIALSDILVELIEKYPKLEGIHHLASEAISRYDLLFLINKVYNLGIQVIPDDKVVRDSSLNSSKFQLATWMKMPSMVKMIEEMYKDYLERK